MRKTKSGFTIVELLIVIVVIGILAAITIVAYNGIQNRTYDTIIQSDLKNIAKQFELYNTDNSVYPVGDTQLATIGIKVTKSAYSKTGSGFGGTSNLLYCRLAASGPTKFALIASSKSGMVFTYKSETGIITSASSWYDSASAIPNCQNAGINQIGASDRDIFYISGAWLSYVGG